MPAGRFISKSIAVNKQLRKVSLEADYLFERCIPHLDREGRLEGDPEVVRAAVCPLRPEMTPEKVEEALLELHHMELVIWYEVEGEKYLAFPGFKNHQTGMKFDREAPSRIPNPPRGKVKSGGGPAEVRTNSANVAAEVPDVGDEVRPREVKLSEVKGSEVKNSTNGHGKVSEHPSPFPKSVCDSLYNTWLSNRGAIQYSAFRKALMPLYPTSGPRFTQDQLTHAIEANAEYVSGLTPKEARFETVYSFAGDIERWVRVGGMGLQDPITGELTERGLLV